MASENIALAHRWCSGLNRGDVGAELWDPELTIVNPSEWAFESAYHGHEGLRRWWEQFSEPFSEIAVELDEVIELEGGRVITVQTLRGRFRTTGLPAELSWAAIATVRDGKILRAEGYASKRRAQRAAGLID